ncbi:hypothetical protein, partial [Haloferula sp. A504]|uniref:hypothetical protein n=1 Tax=Haloferula sp. A504 TaxID=3373601 RepID=UPI0031BF7F22|nr:hypothetical protein [Verrucomicrobiaceae bacterium E54]
SLVEQISGVEQPSGSFNADPKEGGTLDFSGMKVEEDGGLPFGYVDAVPVRGGLQVSQVGFSLSGEEVKGKLEKNSNKSAFEEWLKGENVYQSSIDGEPQTLRKGGSHDPRIWSNSNEALGKAL